MILVIAEPHDTPALWLRNRLAGLLEEPVRLTTPVQLLCSRRIVHRLDSAGGGFEFEASDGARIASEEVDGVVSRILSVPVAQLRVATESDRRYAEEELYAFLLGWLGSIDCPVLNAPSPDGLCGPFHGLLAIRQFAATAGLFCDAAVAAPGAPEPDLHASEGTFELHYALDGRLIGPLVDAGTRDRLLGFARLWGARLLQIQSRSEEGRRRLVGASPLADFRLGGDKLVRAVARALGR